MPTADRYAGCLIGQCLGDALGFVVEGEPAAACRAYGRDYLRAGRGGEIGRDPFPFGQYTDDSQLARELLISLCERGGLVPEDFAGRVARIYTSGAVVGYGRTSMAAAERLARGVPWDQAAETAPKASNGSAMRAAPIGLRFAKDLAAVADAAQRQSAITHADAKCHAAAVVVAATVALALRDDRLAAGTILGALSTLVRDIDRDTAAGVDSMPDWLTLDPSDAAGAIGHLAAPEDRHDDDADGGIGPLALPSVLWSLYAFLRTPDDYWETVCTAIEVGGDVDTTAAMAGAMSGARLGLAAIPRRLAARLNDRGAWTYDELVALAQSCHAEVFG